MKTIKTFLLSICFLTTISVWGQQNPIEKPYIEVTGTAEEYVIPDEIYISISLKEKSKTTVEMQEKSLKEALKSLDIDLKNLSLSDADADYVRVSWKKDVVVTKKYQLKVSDAATVGKVYQKLDELGINEAFIQRVAHSKIDSLKKEIQIKAIKSAKEKANYLLQAVGEKCGKPLRILQDMTFYRTEYKVIPYAGGVRKMNSAEEYKEEKAEDEIRFQKIRLFSEINVLFSIE